jgi:hypothetical protein
MTAMNFPSNPVSGQVYGKYTYDGTKGVWAITASKQTTTSDVKPTSPADGDFWLDTSDGKLYVYYIDVDGGQWVNVSGYKVGPQGIQGTAGATGATGPGVPAGGAVGNILFKTGSGDYTTAWVDGSLTFQTLAAPIKVNPTTITNNYILPVGYNGMSAGPITINDGITVTISDGSVWSIV